MRSPRFGKPRSLPRSISSLSGKLPKLALPAASASASPPRRRPQIGKPAAGKAGSPEHVSLPRNGRK